jgi:hypothetical protein
VSRSVAMARFVRSEFNPLPLCSGCVAMSHRVNGLHAAPVDAERPAHRRAHPDQLPVGLHHQDERASVRVALVLPGKELLGPVASRHPLPRPVAEGGLEQGNSPRRVARAIVAHLEGPCHPARLKLGGAAGAKWTREQ